MRVALLPTTLGTEGATRYYLLIMAELKVTLKSDRIISKTLFRKKEIFYHEIATAHLKKERSKEEGTTLTLVKQDSTEMCITQLNTLKKIRYLIKELEMYSRKNIDYNPSLDHLFDGRKNT